MADPAGTRGDRVTIRGGPLGGNEILAVAFVALLALVIRAILLPAQGHVTDVATFESWMNVLIRVGPKGFYSAAGFVDYPPGYMLILWAVGAVYHATFSFGDASLNAMRAFIKLPAIIGDVGIGYLIFLIARRSWPVPAAIVAMAVFVLNPASWLVSAFWGQADSVAAVFLLWSVYLVVTERYEFAWLSLAFAVLIKPQPLAVAPFLLIWQIKKQGITWRLALAPIMGLAVAYVGSVWFAPAGSPLGVLVWLYDRYHTAVALYPYNSMNALNLYSINRDFMQPDTQPITMFGVLLGPQYAWGIAIFAALCVAIGWRLWHVLDEAPDPAAQEVTLFAACFTVMVGFFMVLTRQHERYLFSALALAPLLWNAGPLMRLAIIVLSTTFSFNLFYALQYLATPGPDLNPPLVHFFSFVNFLTLVVVAGAFLIDDVGEWVNARLGGRRDRSDDASTPSKGRRGPNPFEGLVGMEPIDYVIASAMTAATAVLLFWGIGNPPGRYFDEIYYARAAQEYLSHQPLYEWTHPPVTKLIAAAGAWIFGRFHVADPVGVRMMHACMGTLMVPLLYAFAKRLFSSTGVAATAVFLLVTSGWFYVQARIAQPEITIGLITLAAAYCTYRLWLSAQLTPRSAKPVMPDWRIVAAAVGIVCAVGAYYLIQVWARTAFPKFDYLPYFIVAAALCAISGWWAWRARDVRTARAGVVYPDGTWMDGGVVRFPSGTRRRLREGSLRDGDDTIVWTAEGVDVACGDDRVRWEADGTISGRIEGKPIRDGQHWGYWFALSAIVVAVMISSKWYGLFTLAGLWTAAALATGQQYLPAVVGRSKQSGLGRFPLGNPTAWRLPLYLTSCIAAILIVYVASYIPNFEGATHVGAPAPSWFEQLLGTQWQMWHYHSVGVLASRHPYSSPWWTWPLETRPVDYYYVTVSGHAPANQIVSEIIALPNPAVWLVGIVTVPWAAVMAWRRRHKGVLLLAMLWVSQWVFWAMSPRIDFEYNVFSNLAIVCLCTTFVLQDLWRRASSGAGASAIAKRLAIGAYLALCLGLFLYFFPILSADHIRYYDWWRRMWLPYGGYTWFGWV